MAIPAMTNKSIELPESVSSEIWQKTQDASVVMQLAQSITLPGNGLEIPVITGDPEAGWTAETDEKPVGNHTLTTKTMTPYTIAIIEPFSNQFRDDHAALYDALAGRLPNIIARAFDRTVFGYNDAPGTNFDTMKDVTAIDISTSTYDKFVSAIETVANADAELSAWALSSKARTILLKTKDSNARPLFISNAALDTAPNSVLAIPARFNKNVYRAAVSGTSPETVGFAGDWSGARYGIVNDISISISDQASLTVTDGSETKTLNLWQRNMFAVRAEMRVGFVMRDAAEFVRLDNGTV